MKRVVLLVGLFVLLLFITCKEVVNNVNGYNASNIGKTKEELEKLKEPTENIEKIKDSLSGTKYCFLEKDGTSNCLLFDSTNNKVTITQNSAKILLCIRKYENGKLKFDFTPYEKYTENYNLDTFLSENYALIKEDMEELEKKQNRTSDEEERLTEDRNLLPYYSSAEKYREIDPELKMFYKMKTYIKVIAKIYKQKVSLGTISPDKSTIMFEHFFFHSFIINSQNNEIDLTKPIIHENVVFKKR